MRYPPLSSVEASLSCGEAGEKEKERAGHDGKGEERTEDFRLFSLPIAPRALSIFFSIIAIFIEIPSVSLCGGEMLSTL